MNYKKIICSFFLTGMLENNYVHVHVYFKDIYVHVYVYFEDKMYSLFPKTLSPLLYPLLLIVIL